MKKIFAFSFKNCFFTVLICCLLLSVFSQTAFSKVLKGGVHYTVESARDEAFSKVQYKISMEEHKKYLKDPGFSLDRHGKPKIKKFGRFVTFFSGDGDGYGVTYLFSDYNYYYNPNGELIEIEVATPLDFPYLTQKYDINGNLMGVALHADFSNSFIYLPDKKYVGKWVDSKFYDPQGKVTMTRHN